MVCRADWEVLKQDYKEQGIDISEISRNASKFYDSIANRNKPIEQMVINLLNADKRVNNCRRLTKNLCSPQENNSIKQEEENYKEMNLNIGRVDFEIKKIKESTIKSIKNRGTTASDNPEIKIEEYIKILEEAIDNLAFYPLRVALDNFTNEDNEFYTTKNKKDIKVIKDRKLLIYIIYTNILHSSESMGIRTSQEGSSVSKILPSKITPKAHD